MVKIGRNEPCPCGSGKKYKHCCRARSGMQTEQAAPVRLSLLAAIEKIQAAAAANKQQVMELGVFVFFSTVSGNAWVLEVTDTDAIQVAEAGRALTPPVEESSETIEVNWSHVFVVRDRQLFFRSYEDDVETLIADAPVQEINAAIRRIFKRYPRKMLDEVHVRDE
ncbi:MAG: preprotein translocase subunit SecA [Desulfobulbus propionicus]|nr:MAG: preprotein translocase subunit SecA [Desulfobulbus propionicus]